MRLLRLGVCALISILPTLAAGEPSAAELSAALQHLSLDPEQTYRVRDLRLTRGDIKFYFSEGVLSFVKPVAGHTIAAVFTTRDVEAGDAEVLALPPRRSERVSLASFTKSPNLNEHFGSAAFFFSDDTADELLRQIPEPDTHKAPQGIAELQVSIEPILHNLSTNVELRLIESLLDRHQSDHGYFYSAMAGRELGVFQALYDPDLFEPVEIGKIGDASSENALQLWTSFRPRRAAPFHPAPSPISEYHIDGTIDSALGLSAVVQFQYQAEEHDGRALRFDLSDRLRVASAQIDGHTAEVFQREIVGTTGQREAGGPFLLVGSAPISAGKHSITVAYTGSVIRQTPDKTYFIDDRTTWFPHAGVMRTTFDLTFHCPDSLRLVSTGELVSDEVSN